MQSMPWYDAESNGKSIHYPVNHRSQTPINLNFLYLILVLGTDDGSQSSTQKRIELLKNDEGGVSVYIYESLTVDQSEQHV